MIFVGVDPGGTTGLAAYNTETGLWVFDEIPYEPVRLYNTFGNTIDWNAEDCIFVCEEFDFRRDDVEFGGRAGRPKVDYTAPKVIGILDFFTENQRAPIHYQKAAEGKGFWTDDKLRRVNCYTKGKKHARDATRHVLHYRAFKLRDERLLHELKK